MASMANQNDARAWLNDYLCLAEEGSEWAKRILREGAHEQRANVEAAKRLGSGWCDDVAQYERNVEMIERVVSAL